MVATIRGNASALPFKVCTNWGFPPSSLEVVEKEHKNTHGFKIGVRVVVTKKVTHQSGWDNNWNSDMDEFIGHEFTIKAKMDVVYSGLGWIRIKASQDSPVKIAAWAPEGVAVLLRKALI